MYNSIACYYHKLWHNSHIFGSPQNLSCLKARTIFLYLWPSAQHRAWHMGVPNTYLLPFTGLSLWRAFEGNWVDGREWNHIIWLTLWGHLGWLCPCPSQEDLLYTTLPFHQILELFSFFILFGPGLVRITHHGLLHHPFWFSYTPPTVYN